VITKDIIIYSVGVPSGKDHLGSIRAVLDTTNSVISAQDYDAWGYILENRQWIDPLLPFGEDGRGYKFTGKERDKDLENNYDYFGARYYDSRIGRWGGVEPLLDKYLSISPYIYSVCNPIIAKDINGKDARVSIEGNKIKVEVEVFYTKNEDFKYHFDDNSENTLLNYIDQANEQWNEAASNIEFNGQNYEVTFDIKATEVYSGKTFQQISSESNGKNFAIYNEEKNNPGVENGNILRIVSTEGKEIPRYAGSHEVGHLIGLHHPYPVGSKKQKESTDIMGYNKYHNPPESKNVKSFLNLLDFNKGFQIVGGSK